MTLETQTPNHRSVKTSTKTKETPSSNKTTPQLTGSKSHPFQGLRSRPQPHQHGRCLPAPPQIRRFKKWRTANVARPAVQPCRRARGAPHRFFSPSFGIHHLRPGWRTSRVWHDSDHPGERYFTGITKAPSAPAVTRKCESHQSMPQSNTLLDGWETRFVAPNGSPLNREYEDP